MKISTYDPRKLAPYLREVSDCVKASRCRRTNIEAISDMLKYTMEKPTMHTMKP
jgi:hypothetical protein